MKNIFKKTGRILFRFVIAFFIISIATVVFFRWLPIPVTPFMLTQCVSQTFDSKRKVKLQKKWTSLEQISPYLQLAVICSEDQNFIDHFGFDFDAIEKAMEHNKSHKQKRGASTISQQTAKNVFLYDGRNWIRKGLEVYFTFLIEVCWSKQRIMEVYLNVIEFGDGIYGAEAAAQQFFKIPSEKLSASQAAMLAAILPAPRRFSATNPSFYILKRQQWILSQMKNNGDKLKFDNKGE